MTYVVSFLRIWEGRGEDISKAMKMKNLSKASGLFEKIKALDVEIIQIEKMAILLANSETSSNVEFIVIEKNAEPKIEIDPRANDMLDTFHYMLRNDFAGGGWRDPRPSPSNESKNNLKQAVSETLMLKLLGVLLEEKNRERKLIISELNSIDVK